MEQERPNKARKCVAMQDVTGVTRGNDFVACEAKSATPFDLFQNLSDDILRHIFSYRMCLNEDCPRPVTTAVELFRDEQREVVTARNPGKSFYAISEILNTRYELLSHEQAQKWKKLAKPDQERYRQEKAAMVTPFQLFGIMNGLSLVSKQWYNVVGDAMNTQAPSELLSPRDLFELKCRALSLDLGPVCNVFIEKLQETWGSERIHDDDNDGESHVALDLIFPYYGGSRRSFANLVATEYVKFLVVKCVETISVHRDCAEVTDTIETWREPCRPTNLLDLFWQAHRHSPEKYSSDCRMLIGELLNDPANSIIENTTNFSCSVFDYHYKRSVLFQFERQLPPTDFFWGRFGDRRISKHKMLSEDFDIRVVATLIWHQMKECERAEEQEGAEERRRRV